jgi:hypothetical protein
MTTKTRLARAALALGAAAVTMTGLTAGGAAAAPPLYTETSLNSASSLATNFTGAVVAAPPNAADGRQRWQAIARYVHFPNGQAIFGWQLKNNATLKCITDIGDNLQVRERDCESAPSPGTKQVWQNTDARSVNGLTYWFWRNLTTTRRLQVDDLTSGALPTFTVIATSERPTQGTALEALQLWNERRVF